MNKGRKNLILALETGINGGSLAVLEGAETLCTTEGAGNVSKAEELLALLEELLEENGLNREEIGIIVISDSPGSATGLRIGLSTARGLAGALGAEVLKLSILHTQVIVSGAGGRLVSALYAGKNGIYYRFYEPGDNGLKPLTEILNTRNLQDFTDSIPAGKCSYVLDKKLALLLKEREDFRLLFEQNEIKILEGSLAESLGIAAFKIASDNEEVVV